MLLLPGDWSSDAPNYPPRTEDRHAWATEVASLLLPRRVDVFQKHRWVNNLAPVREIALIANCHQLLRKA
eukprot:9634599-Alexandrium_andersonii.AAC.1